MKHIFIINPCAGIASRVKETIGKIKRILKKDEYEIHETTCESDAEKFVREYNNNGKVRFYACGGDGTLNEVVNGAINKPNTEVTCYPIGSGNDFLKYFGHPIKFLDLEKLVHGTSVKCDLLKCNDKYSINVFNMGFDGGVAHRQKKIKKWPFVSGKMAYNISVGVSLFTKINHKIKLFIDEKLVYEGKSALLAMANAICYGGGYYCAPRAKINDGLIDVCLVKKVNLIQFAKLVKSYKKGTHLENPKAKPFIDYYNAKHIEVMSEKKLYCSRDGEIFKTNKVVVDIIPNAIDFIVPSEV